MTSPDATSQSLHPLPLVVQIGFAGARHLFPDGQELAESARIDFEARLLERLQQALGTLSAHLGLSAGHFMVGVSQMAAGGDLLFSRAACKLGWGLRVLLPQPREQFLDALGSEGPDFTPPQAQQARAMLDSTHVIEETVVSHAHSRRERFLDVNAAILEEADALVCLRVAGREGRPGGTQAMIKRARELDMAVLELVLRVADDGSPGLDATFHPALDRRGQPRSVAPTLPSTAPEVVPPLRLAKTAHPAEWPDLRTYASALKQAASAGAGRRQTLFRSAAGIVVGTHVAATLLALLAIAAASYGPGWLLATLLAIEVALLLWGYLTHRHLHHGRQTEHWAMARLCAEVCRSALAYGRLPGSLRYLLALPMPETLRPLLRTFLVLHLRDVKRLGPEAWRDEFRRYLRERLEHEEHGQIVYYQRKQQAARSYAEVVGWMFVVMSLMAMAATGVKLALKLSGVHTEPWLGSLLGILAVLLPVVAVGALSFAAALDMEARVHTFAQMHEFVERQGRHLAGVASAGEAAQRAAETETRLLGETVVWYARRAYISIA